MSSSFIRKLKILKGSALGSNKCFAVLHIWTATQKTLLVLFGSEKSFTEKQATIGIEGPVILIYIWQDDNNNR